MSHVTFTIVSTPRSLWRICPVHAALPNHKGPVLILLGTILGYIMSRVGVIGCRKLWSTDRIVINRIRFLWPISHVIFCWGGCLILQSMPGVSFHRLITLQRVNIRSFMLTSLALSSYIVLYDLLIINQIDQSISTSTKRTKSFFCKITHFLSWHANINVCWH